MREDPAEGEAEAVCIKKRPVLLPAALLRIEYAGPCLSLNDAFSRADSNAGG
jgi:hypothetical protein